MRISGPASGNEAAGLHVGHADAHSLLSLNLLYTVSMAGSELASTFYEITLQTRRMARSMASRMKEHGVLSLLSFAVKSI